MRSPSEEQIHAGTGFHQLNQALKVGVGVVFAYRSPG